MSVIGPILFSFLEIYLSFWIQEEPSWTNNCHPHIYFYLVLNFTAKYQDLTGTVMCCTDSYFKGPKSYCMKGYQFTRLSWEKRYYIIYMWRLVKLLSSQNLSIMTEECWTKLNFRRSSTCLFSGLPVCTTVVTPGLVTYLTAITSGDSLIPSIQSGASKRNNGKHLHPGKKKIKNIAVNERSKATLHLRAICSNQSVFCVCVFSVHVLWWQRWKSRDTEVIGSTKAMSL